MRITRITLRDSVELNILARFQVQLDACLEHQHWIYLLYLIQLEERDGDLSAVAYNRLAVEGGVEVDVSICYVKHALKNNSHGHWTWVVRNNKLVLAEVFKLYFEELGSRTDFSGRA